jgi:hypothetical protein
MDSKETESTTDETVGSGFHWRGLYFTAPQESKNNFDIWAAGHWQVTRHKSLRDGTVYWRGRYIAPEPNSNLQVQGLDPKRAWDRLAALDATLENVRGHLEVQMAHVYRLRRSLEKEEALANVMASELREREE